MKKIKEVSRESAGRRKRNPVVYIICEGTETEIRYFKRFRSRYCHIDILPIPSQYKAADKLVQKVKSTLGNNPYYPKDGDELWCVFYRDDNTNDMLNRAKTTADKAGYKIAYSNPSFELWFLWHFVKQKSEVADSQAVIRLLQQKGRLEQYEKSADVYDALLPHQPKAIERAEQRIKELEDNHDRVICRESNPVSTVSELIKYLNENR